MVLQAKKLDFLRRTMRAFSKVLYIEDVHLGTSGFLLLGGGGREGLEDLGGVEGGSVVVNRVQGGREFKKLTAK